MKTAVELIFTFVGVSVLMLTCFVLGQYNPTWGMPEARVASLRKQLQVEQPAWEQHVWLTLLDKDGKETSCWGGLTISKTQQQMIVATLPNGFKVVLIYDGEYNVYSINITKDGGTLTTADGSTISINGIHLLDENEVACVDQLYDVMGEKCLVSFRYTPVGAVHTLSPIAKVTKPVDH